MRTEQQQLYKDFIQYLSDNKIDIDKDLEKIREPYEMVDIHDLPTKQSIKMGYLSKLFFDFLKEKPFTVDTVEFLLHTGFLV